MKALSIVLFTVVLISTASISLAVEDSFNSTKKNTSPKTVLFVGNSFSYFNNGIPRHLTSLAKSKGLWQKGKSKSRLLALSAGRLSEYQHILPSFLSHSKTKWDLVILQEQSNNPLKPEKNSHFRASAQQIVQNIRDQGSQAAFLMTWPYKNRPEMATKLSAAYQTLGSQLNTPIIPVGLAFEQLNKSYPDINLYTKDIAKFDGESIRYRKNISHPSEAGSYLAACVIFAALYDQSPEGALYISSLSPNEALILQQTAWQTVQAFNGKSP